MLKDYGRGISTGLDQTALGMIQTGFKSADMQVSSQDTETLRRLAERVAQIAATPRQAEIRELWRRHNRLEKVRPPVFCDPENGWNEIITTAEMQCRGVLARRWEMNLRKEIFWGEVMGDDKPVAGQFVVPYTVYPDDWGLETVYHHTDQATGSQSWDAPVQDYDRDMPKLRMPDVRIDVETTQASLRLARELFDGILDVRLQGTWWWSLGLTLPAVMLRGMTNLFMDFIDQPDEVKGLLQFISNAHLKKLDYLEQNGLLSLNNNGTYVGSGGFGYTDELPQPDFAGQVRCQDIWGFAESQETVSVSPEMYEEFIFPFEKPILDRFGMNCYGCCEPVDPRWDIVRRHSNLRRVSCSPWADYERAAGMLEDRYIFSMKVNPAEISRSHPDYEKIKRDLIHNLEITKGCRVEIIMKDNHTLGGGPENAVEWCRMAKEAVDAVL